METCSSQVQPTPRPQSSNSRPANENQNNITISLPQQQFPQTCQGDVKAITLQPQPIKLSVDTPTDWPSVGASIFVGLSGAMVALAVGLMAYFGQRSQARASRANFRHAWQQEFKQYTGRFISTSLIIKLDLDSKVDYLSIDEHKQLFRDLVESKIRIEIMLDHSKPYFGEIARLAENIVNAVVSGSASKMNDLIKNGRSDEVKINDIL